METPKLFYFDKDTPDAVQMCVKDLYATKERARFFYGDAATGIAWPEEFQVSGAVGRSTGPKHIPLVIHSARSYGGGALSTSSIVAIRTKRGWKYKHPSFSVGEWTIYNDTSVAGCVVRVDHNGQEHARFKTHNAADRFVKFMKGERLCK